MGRRTRAVELVLGDVIEHAVSDQNADNQSTIVHQATIAAPSHEPESSLRSNTILDNCQEVDAAHPQFDTSRALKHGIAHSILPPSGRNGISDHHEDSVGSSVNEEAVSTIGRLPSAINFKPIGNLTLLQFQQAITQKHEVRYRTGAESRIESTELKPQSRSPAKPSLKSIKFGFKSYAGAVFAAIRSTLGISTGDYVQSLANGEAFHDFVSNSKSGAFFFFTTDGRYIIKTMSHSESLWFRGFMPGYFQHLHHHPRSLLVRIAGLYRLKFNGGRQNTLHFYVMLNVFSRNELIPIHAKFDLKGSTFGRTAKASEPVLKDIDFSHQKTQFRFGQHASSFLSILNADLDFLSKALQMDYSLLVGIYDRAQDPLKPTDEQLLSRLGYSAEDVDRPDAYDRRGILSLDADGRIRFVYFLGIIDYLQKYNWKKKAEHFFKAIRHKGDSISAVNPLVYANRFRTFIEKNLIVDQPLAS